LESKRFPEDPPRGAPERRGTRNNPGCGHPGHLVGRRRDFGLHHPRLGSALDSHVRPGAAELGLHLRRDLGCIPDFLYS
jgi:hypothetical protein